MGPTARAILLMARVVAASGAIEVGQWVTLKRDLSRDFVRAFGEEPRKLLAAGVLTDSDKKNEAVRAWYGEVRIEPANL